MNKNYLVFTPVYKKCAQREESLSLPKKMKERTKPVF